MPRISPMTYIKESFQSGSGSSGSSSKPPTRTIEINATKKIICNLKPVFDNLQCSAYLQANPTPPAVATPPAVPQPAVTIKGSINNLSNVASTTGDLTASVRPNDMIYFGYLLDVQGPFVVTAVTPTSIRFSTKYLGPNLTDSIMSVISTSTTATTTTLVEVSENDAPKNEVYIFRPDGPSVNRTLAQAQQECAKFGGTVPTLEQMKEAYNGGANWCLSSLVTKNGVPINAKPIQTVQATGICANSIAGVTEDPTPTSIGKYVSCYGVKPPAGLYILFAFSGPYDTQGSEVPLLQNDPKHIIGSVKAGTSYITTRNTSLPDNIKIGDVIEIKGKCNQYDTDNGADCTAYDCKLGEKDLLRGNLCQRYKCRDLSGNQAAHINNGDGTCTAPPTYNNCMRGFITSGTVTSTQGATCTSGPNTYRQTVSIPAFNYDIVKAGVADTTYTKTSANRSYRYPKSLGPYYVAANPAINKILIRSKTAGDLDANGMFAGTSSNGWALITTNANSISHGNGQIYCIVNNKNVMYFSNLNEPKALDITGNIVGLSNSYRYNVKCVFASPGIESSGRKCAHTPAESRCKPPAAPGAVPRCTNKDPGDVLLNSISVDTLNPISKYMIVLNSFNTANSRDPLNTLYEVTPNNNFPQEIVPFYGWQTGGQAVSWSTTGVPNIAQIISNGKTFGWTPSTIYYNSGSSNPTNSAWTANTPPYNTETYYTGGSFSSTSWASFTIPNPSFYNLKQLSFDGYNMTLMAIDIINNVWFANANITTAPNWANYPTLLGLSQAYGGMMNPGTQAQRDAVNAAKLQYISHSNGKWVGIGTDNKIYYSNNYTDPATRIDITDGITNPVQVSFDGNNNTVAVLTSAGNVYYKSLSAILNPSIANRVSKSFGLQHVTLSRIAYDTTSGSGSRISLNKKILGCPAGTAGAYCEPCPAGQSSSPAAASCTPCPAGQTSVSGGQCTLCAGGTVGADGSCSIMGYITSNASVSTNITTSIVELSGGPSNTTWLSALTVRLPTGLTAGVYASNGSTITINTGWVAYGYINENPTSRMRLDTVPYSGVAVPIRINTYFFILVKEANLTYTAAGNPVMSGTALPLKICPTGYCCDAGYYSNQYSDICNQCVANTYSAAGASSCSICLNNQTSIPGSSSCSNCPNNTSSIGGQPCTNCPNNMTSIGGQGCAACPQYTASIGGQACIDACPPGSTNQICLGKTYTTTSNGFVLTVPVLIRSGQNINATIQFQENWYNSVYKGFLGNYYWALNNNTFRGAFVACQSWAGINNSNRTDNCSIITPSTIGTQTVKFMYTDAALNQNIISAVVSVIP